VRWGAEGEAKMVKVYSNCPAAELFVNGKSVGVRQRNSQDFPAAGLRWMAVFTKGRNHLRVVAQRDGQTVSDELEFTYQTEKWAEPARLVLREIARQSGVATIEARLLDARGVQCLDARAGVRFSLAGAGRLLDNLGTSNGSRVVQLYNGRAEISIELAGECVASVSSGAVSPAFVRMAAPAATSK
jgi:beta-galactosidase